MENKQLPPNAIAALVNGILSINFSSLVIPGIILAIIGLVKSRKGYEVLIMQPDAYTGEKLLKAGRITSIIGLIASIASIFLWIAYVAFLVKMIN